MSDATPPRDERPRPQYGEYATPEEQRAHIRHPDVTAAIEAGESLSAAAAAAAAAQPAAAPASDLPPVVAAGRPARPVDRVITMALLGFGLVNVLFSVVSYFDLADAITQAMQILGIEEEFTNTAAADLWGPIAAVVLTVGYVITTVVALRSLRARRLSWWIPLVGAVITYIGVYACLLVPFVGDPAFMQYVSSGA
ncbi:DUF6264 family protein [Microbacterium terricola]|uniref:Uncharacterized protein n=1 Tax=Microbacterium terricola TaxID=344163 RepID=A0ABM8DZW8_9MICO|nr:DUF6264 family protein [Microbacterium terricola]UYK41168.1 DUF6264 family protein [Microbacterium terricola]BDV31061.1 hypothetical protein Microterr_17210 [Microbacterium terricola]